MRLHCGCDFRLQVDTIEDALDHPTKYTINHKSYLLVEFPDSTVFPNSDEVLMQLLDAGMIPIITHRNGIGNCGSASTTWRAGWRWAVTCRSLRAPPRGVSGGMPRRASTN